MLGWTRHDHRLADLDIFNQALASPWRPRAHLELLVARGQVTRLEAEEGVVFAAVG